jgi:hypothetical protein
MLTFILILEVKISAGLFGGAILFPILGKTYILFPIREE